MGPETNGQKNVQMYTVSRLSREIKSLLEEKFPFVWISGEISNCATPASGHSYFTLKDETSVIQCVMFKNQKRSLKFSLENGLKIFGLARLTLYEPRGSYQLIFEHIEPEGAGSAQLAFEQLKEKLSGLGYFDEDIKKSIPYLPEAVSLITSSTGAAVRDFLQISQRRFPNCVVQILPVSVQGDAAIDEICSAIELANKKNTTDLIVLCRGGGSIEDLAAFNAEPVARSIFESRLPVVTGIGHETDYTIADFTADMRAPTPSAAAELVFKDKKNLVYTIDVFQDRLNQAMKSKTDRYRQAVAGLAERLKSPKTQLFENRLKLDDYQDRLTKRLKLYHIYNKEKADRLTQSLKTASPANRIPAARDRIDQLTRSLNQAMRSHLAVLRLRHASLAAELEGLGPANVLQRGYSITRSADTRAVITDSGKVDVNDQVEVILHRGKLTTRIEQTHG